MTKKTLKTVSKAGSKRKKYGIRTFLRTGICPPDKHYLEVMADKQILRMADDLGGLAALAGTQITILREIRQLLVLKFLCDEKIMAAGIFKKDSLELAGPLNNFYLSCSNSITRNCIALGLRKISGADDTLEGYLANYERKHKAKDSSAPVIEAGEPLTKGTTKKRSALSSHVVR